MNILIFSHSSEFGGAERALLSLIKLLIKTHQVAVMLPSQKGELVDKLRAMGVKCGVLHTSSVLPTPANTFLRLYDAEIVELIGQLREKNYDLIISNTLAALLGLLIGKELNVPCLTYVHECLGDDPDLRPHGCSAKFFLSQIENLSSHILCASEYVKNSFSNQNKCSVLYPFENYIELPSNKVSSVANAEFSLLVIGTKSRRKNTHFAITVLKALRLRGLNISLHLVGSENSGSFKLRQQIQLRGEKNVYIHPHMQDPFAVPGRKIHLICSIGEPFGLTITEGLFRGVPVIASNSGGPNEILPSDFLYSVNDLDGCVRAIENIIIKYDDYCLVAKSQYLKISAKNEQSIREEIISNAIFEALDYFKSSNKHSSLNFIKSFRAVREPIVDSKTIMNNISEVSSNTDRPLMVSEIEVLVKEEIKTPGSAIKHDIERFDVVPFTYSQQMTNLYREGLGLAVELLANLGDVNKQRMMANIVLRLHELKLTKPNLRILCLGDGLGIDSIALASCGFHVDYLDFDKSLMSRCAELNVNSATMANNNKKLEIKVLSSPNPPYDAIVSLEVIEHVSEPQSFMSYISENLSPGGLLFISECFEGIFDRWPTNLYLNEKYASSLPIIALPFFNVEDINSEPLGKPYIFSKRVSSIVEDNSLEMLEEPDFLASYVNAKMRIGF